MKGEFARLFDLKPPVPALDDGIERSGIGVAVMVSRVDQKLDAQSQPATDFRGTGQKPVGQIGRVGTRFHPDAVLQPDAAEGEAPDRHASLQAKGLDMEVDG